MVTNYVVIKLLFDTRLCNFQEEEGMSFEVRYELNSVTFNCFSIMSQSYYLRLFVWELPVIFACKMSSLQFMSCYILISQQTAVINLMLTYLKMIIPNDVKLINNCNTSHSSFSLFWEFEWINFAIKFNLFTSQFLDS